MSTIQENLQIISDSLSNIKQSIINKGGNINGDITTYATAIADISTVGGGEREMPTNLVTSSEPNTDNAKIYEYLSQLSLNGSPFTNNNWSDLAYVTIDRNGISVINSAGVNLVFSENGALWIDNFAGGYN